MTRLWWACVAVVLSLGPGPAAQRQVPLFSAAAIVLAFDGSGSTEGRNISDLVEAGHALIAGLKPNDRIALTTFNHAVAPRVSLTSEFSQVAQALERIEPRGQTAILDGIHSAIMTTQAEAGRFCFPTRNPP